MTDEFEEQTIKQNRGPTIAFTGKLLASDEHESRGMRLRFEIWETRSGALIAASYSEPIDGRGFVDTRAEVVEPKNPGHWPLNQTFPTPMDDEAVHRDMRFAVMEAFNWDNRARAMARKLGWSLRMEVE